MKKSSLLMIVAAIVLSSCGITTQYTSTTDNSRFQDGIYSSSPSFRSKEERSDSRTKTDALIEETKASQIFLFGEKKDTVVIPQNMSASIRYDKSLASTVVTIGENPYAWENNLDLWSYYTPYSIGSSWYWNRWPYSSWSYYSGWYDPWYYGGIYDPWYYGGWYGYGYMSPYHCGWYHHHHHHHHYHAGPVHIKDQWHGNRRYTGSDRVFTSRVSTRAGAGTSSRVSRVSSSQTSGRANTSAVTSKRTAPTRVATSPARASASRKATVSNHRSPSTSVTRSSSSGTPDRRTSVRSTSSSSYRGSSSSSSSYRSSSSSSYRSSSSSSSSRSSSYSTGSGRSYSSGGGGSMRSSGSGVSRSGGSTRR